MTGPPPREVHVTWTIEDARAFARIVIDAQLPLMQREEGWLWRRAAALAGAVVASGLSFLATDSPAYATGGAILGYLLVTAGMWANHFGQNRPDAVDGLFRNDPLLYAPRRFEATDAALIERRDGILREVRWERVQRLGREANLIIVWLSKIDALPIPERSFSTSADADAFFALLTERVAAATPAEPPAGREESPTG